MLEGLYLSYGLGLPRDPQGGAGKGTSGLPRLSCCHSHPDSDKGEKIDGGIDVKTEMLKNCLDY